MPIDPSVFTHTAFRPGEALKQCQYCFKVQDATVSLKSCSRCKRAHYCSRECQVADWAFHKGRCGLNVETAAKAKAKAQELHQSSTTSSTPSSTAAATSSVSTDPRRTISDLKKWSQAHRPALSIAAIHALELKAHPERIMNSVLMISLSRSSDGNKRVPHHLKVDDAYVASIDDVRTAYSEKHGSFDQLDAILHQSQTLQKHTGAMGIAIVFALIGPVMNVIPLGLADPAITKDYVYDPNWLEWFRAAIRG